ncbi:MAG: addiction module protein [Planctomycetaceae bacterium]
MSQMVTYDEVLRTARSLDEPERARLVEELLGSFSADDAAPPDDAWLAEIDRRSDELDAGTVATIPWQEVRQRARERAKLNG